MIRTLLIFGLAGPLISGFVTNLLLFLVLFLPLVIKVHGIENLFAILHAAAAIIAAGVLYSILLAIAPAIIAGIMIALRDKFRGQSTIWHANSSGLFAGLAAAGFYWGFLDWSSQEEKVVGAVMVVAGSIAAAVICWRLTRPRMTPLIERET